MSRAPMVRVLVVLVLTVVAVGAVAAWRGEGDNTSQPHVPGWQGTPQR
jgi:hypothetical protein